jgi:hypothetical protein
MHPTGGTREARSQNASGLSLGIAELLCLIGGRRISPRLSAIKCLPVLIYPARVLLVRRKPGNAGTKRFGRITMLPDGLLCQTNVHPEKRFCISVGRLRRLTRVRH